MTLQQFAEKYPGLYSRVWTDGYLTGLEKGTTDYADEMDRIMTGGKSRSESRREVVSMIRKHVPTSLQDTE